MRVSQNEVFCRGGAHLFVKVSLLSGLLSTRIGSVITVAG